jgi:hypothetical protein
MAFKTASAIPLFLLADIFPRFAQIRFEKRQTRKYTNKWKEKGKNCKRIVHPIAAFISF